MTKNSVSKKKKAASQEIVEEKVQPIKKPKAVGIDMSRIPESLRKEGYCSDLEDENPKVLIQTTATVPDYLNCPVCKELFISPEMYACGHSVCKMCVEVRLCPVCKAVDHRPTVPNFVVIQLIESQYPEKFKQRQKELDEIVELRKKVSQYPISSRFSMLAKQFEELMDERQFVFSKEVIEYLKAAKITLKAPITEQEAKYFLSWKLNNYGSYICVGDQIVRVSDLSSHLSWLETYTKSRKKKKLAIDPLKWLPLHSVCFTKPATPFAIYQRIAQLYKIDIGLQIPFDEWRNQPSFWIKECDLGDVVHFPMDSHYQCGCPHHMVDSSDEEDEDDSESDF